jgi:hypothetical protein
MLICCTSGYDYKFQGVEGQGHLRGVRDQGLGIRASNIYLIPDRA